MAAGVYVHIPYCLQRCSYCDFATFEWKQILPPEDYVELVKKEIQSRSALVPFRSLDTVYFGGGTPSLISAELIVSILKELEKCGFNILPNAEVTIEINPATIDEEKLKIYLDHGVNRFSVGAQSFNDKMLKGAGRKHSAEDTVNTLSLLKKNNLSYSFDLLFALPEQSLEMLQDDVNMVRDFAPSHLSAYCLTVPEGHSMSVGRAPEGEQLEMFSLLEEELPKQGLELYEISNFAKPGFESRHNLLYWTDQNYWGLGLSAHSYFKEPHWGKRFWNHTGIEPYKKQVLENTMPVSQKETLEKHQAFTDFCHTSMRLTRGIDVSLVEKKFGDVGVKAMMPTLLQLQDHNLVEKSENSFRLTPQGRRLSNLAFEKLTFLSSDLA